MHRVMGVDIETYSSVDLAEAGVYAYVEAPDFDILLISYIFDDWGEDDVKTIDCFDADPDMMAEFCEALLDPQIVKTAFNANFERTCLAKWLQKPMPPEEWRCTMVKALTLGLPGNLAGAGEALGLPPEKLKDPQGKALIQFFSKPCKPTRTNDQRTRNLPQHDPAKWQLYKFNAFYAEFVAKSNASYSQFKQMAKAAYDGFTAAIDEYIEALETKGNTDLTAVTEAMKEFQRTSQNAFNEWFATVQGLLDEDVAGRLINKTSDLDERLTALEYMIIHNDLFTHVVDDDGNPILDDDGNAIIGDWKYKTA